jgi:hypothetical protein
VITEAALLKDGAIYTGKRHCDCIRKVVEATGIKPAGGVQGFVTDTGEFLDRKQAQKHALECGQLLKPKRILFSEDLW